VNHRRLLFAKLNQLKYREWHPDASIKVENKANEKENNIMDQASDFFRLQELKLSLSLFVGKSLVSSALRFILIEQLQGSVFEHSF
jgi:hypothetical protein